MVRVVLDNVVLADCDAPVVLEGNYYFPPESVRKGKHLSNSTTSSVCPWKGTASYYSADVDGKSVKDVAWYYPHPSAKASHIKDHVAFYKNKVIIED